MARANRRCVVLTVVEGRVVKFHGGVSHGWMNRERLKMREIYREYQRRIRGKIYRMREGTRGKNKVRTLGFWIKENPLCLIRHFYTIITML